MRALLFGLVAGSALVLLLPSVAAQPPALQPRVETHPFWRDLPERSITLGPEGVFSAGLKVGTRLFVSGGAFACQPNTVYEFTVGPIDGPSWGVTTLAGQPTADVQVAVPPGPHNVAWPGPQQWFLQDGPVFELRWNFDQTPDNATFEYKVTGTGAARIVSGGCAPDPLEQPARHTAETVNITRPYVPPQLLTQNATDASGAEPASAPAAEEDTPGLGATAIIAVAAAAVFRRRK